MSISDDFQYRLEDEEIIAYMKLTPKEKLQWLEEMVNLQRAIYEASDEKTRRVFKRFGGFSR